MYLFESPDTRPKALLAVVAIIILVCGCGSLYRQPQGERPFVFGVLADIQYADKDTIGARHYRTSQQKLKECVASSTTGIRLL